MSSEGREGDPMSDTELDFTIIRIGECRIPSPMKGARFTRDDERVLYHARLEDMKPWIDARTDPPSMEVAGPREKICFDPLQWPRDRDVRRYLPWAERRDTVDRPEPAPPLRCAQGIRVSLRVRGSRATVRTQTAGTFIRRGRPHPRNGRDYSRFVPGASGPRRRW